MDFLLNETTLSTLLWTGLIFGILVTVLAVYAWPSILSALQEREKRIQGEIDKAEHLRQDAEAVLAQYKEQMDHARSDAQKVIEEGKADAEALKARTLEEQRKETEAMKRRALREIELARDKALEEIHKQTVDLSIQIAAKLVAKNLNARDHKKFIEETLAQAKASAKGSA